MTWAGLVQLRDAGAEPSVPPSPPDDGCPPPDDVLPDEPDDDALPEDDALPDEPPDDDAPPEDDAVPDKPEEDEEAADEDGPPDDDELPDDEELLDDGAPVPAPLSPHPYAQARGKPRTEAGSRCRIMNPSIRVARTRRWNGNRRAFSRRDITDDFGGGLQVTGVCNAHPGAGRVGITNRSLRCPASSPWSPGYR